MSLNDPQWGRGGGANDGSDGQRPGRRPGGQEGPPDLEELWRELNRRLGGLFGRGGRGGGDDGGGGSDAWHAALGVSAVLAAILIIWMSTGFYIVQEGQVGVVSTFGRYDSTTGAGFRWRAPWPIQSHEIVDVFSQREIEIGTKARGQDRLKEALMLTDDENIVDVQFKVQYRIKSGAEGARDFVFGSRFTVDGDPVGVVQQTAESAMREVVGRRKMDQVLSGEASRQQIADDVRSKMQEMLDRYSTGILVTAVPIQNVQPPEQVQPAFNDVTQAEQDKKRQLNEGDAYSNDVVPRARGAAARLIQEAEGYRTRTVETAQGDAARFRQVLSEYVKAPAVTRERLYLDTMQQIFASTTKVLVDTRASSPLLYLPLDKLIQQSVADPGRAAPGSLAPGSALTGKDGTPSVEVRGQGTPGDRDRESR